MTTERSPDAETRSARRTANALLKDQLDAANREAAAWRERAERETESAKEWQKQRAPDPEAEALAGCVRAIEEMRDAASASRQTSSLAAYEPVRPSMPIERILLHLAARYGVKLVAPPDQTPAFDAAQQFEYAVGTLVESLRGLRGGGPL